jgi:hypothetical protein
VIAIITARLCRSRIPLIVRARELPPDSSPRVAPALTTRRPIKTESKANMSSDPLNGRRARDSGERPGSPADISSLTGGTPQHDHCDPSAKHSARNPYQVAARRLDSRERARRIATARHVLVEPEKFRLTQAREIPRPSCTPMIAARTRTALRQPASFAEKISLAETDVLGGIKHGTVRNESTPRVRAANILPITHTTGRQESSSRVTPSRLALLSPMSSSARPSRSDRTSVGCRTSEDQGGPP